MCRFAPLIFISKLCSGSEATLSKYENFTDLFSIAFEITMSILDTPFLAYARNPEEEIVHTSGQAMIQVIFFFRLTK